MLLSIFVFGLLNAVVFFFARRMVTVVHEGEAVVIERLGRYYETYGPGICWPTIAVGLYSAKVVHWERQVESDRGSKYPPTRTEVYESFRIKTCEQTYDMPPLPCFTVDKVPVSVNLVVSYHISDVRKAAYVDDLWRAIKNDLEPSLQTLVAEYTPNDLTALAIEKRLRESMVRSKWGETWGIKLMRVGVQGITFSEAFTTAIVHTAGERARLGAEEHTLESTQKRELITLKYRAEVAAQQREMDLAKLHHDVAQERLRMEALSLQDARERGLQQARYAELRNSGLSEPLLIATLQADAWNSINAQCQVMVVPSDYASLIGRTAAMRATTLPGAVMPVSLAVGGS